MRPKMERHWARFARKRLSGDLGNFMGIYDRDYERSYDTGSGWRDSYGPSGGMRSWSVNSKLLATMVGVFVVQVLFEPDFTRLFSLPSDWLTRPWRAYGLVTYGFLHDTSGIGHILFNGIALFFFGRAIEARNGSREYLAFFLTAVVAAGLMWTVAELLSQGQNAVILGASGGVSAVLVLFALYYPHQLIYIWGVIPMPAWLLVGIGVLMDIFGVFGARGGNVAFTAHLGGALFAFLYFRQNWRIADAIPAGLFSGEFKMPSFKRRPKLKIHLEEDHEAVDPLEKQVDRILKKIRDQGQESLTRKEQQLLQRASKEYQQKKNR